MSVNIHSDGVQDLVSKIDVLSKRVDVLESIVRKMLDDDKVQTQELYEIIRALRQSTP